MKKTVSKIELPSLSKTRQFNSLHSIFSGIQGFTTIDDPGFLSGILFTGGCNFRCSYCHNPNFVFPENIEFLPREKITSFLTKRKDLLESITICGGEPTMHRKLVEWITYIKSFGYRVKLDTNGSNPKMITELISKKCVDFFAIDYKAPIADYSTITETNINQKNIQETIEIIVKSGVDYELRSTIHPDLHSDLMIRNMINEVSELQVNSYYLQHFIQVEKTVGELEPIKTKLDLTVYLPLLKNKFDRFGLRNT